MQVPSSIEYQLFPESYFSGCDISIYIGEHWVDDIVSLQFSLMEQVQPLYGYNSYTYDAVARGSRTIQGSFRINFREANYLRRILEEYKEAESFSTSFLEAPFQRVPGFDSIYGKKIDYNKSSTFKIPRKLSWKKEDPLESAYGSKAQIGQEASFRNTPHFDCGKNGFNIVVVYGVPSPSLDGISTPNTFHNIVGVQVIGATQVISPDGTPVFEDYGFIARDLN